MRRFLVQVSRNRGATNILDNGIYENDRWQAELRNKDHGKVKQGDQLLIYCTGSVPKHSKKLAFSVDVKAVSSDHVRFDLDTPQFFASPLSRDAIQTLVHKGTLPDVFLKCGQQGFNIIALDSSSVEIVLELLNPRQIPDNTNVGPAGSESEFLDAYGIENIISDGCFLDEDILTVIIARLKMKKNLILQGPPGTGKTWLAKRIAFALTKRKSNHRVRVFQFHSNLSYEDFVRGWRPDAEGKLDLVDGPFLMAAEEAKNDPDNSYVLVIEEINRGNPAQIFGEMLTLLEADKRNKEEAMALSHHKDPNERVFIPCNLYIIGTMNLADRSLALVDLALRRRFVFFELEPVFSDVWLNWVHREHDISFDFLVKIAQRIENLNRQIADDSNLGPQFCIGHSFVIPVPNEKICDSKIWFTQVVKNEIVPMLREYWFNDPDKVKAAESNLLNI